MWTSMHSYKTINSDAIVSTPTIFHEYDPEKHTLDYVDTEDLLGLPLDEDVESEEPLVAPVLHPGEGSMRNIKNKDFGGKDITFLGGFSLLINNMTGAAVATIPVIFQQAGWFTPLITIVFMTVLSTYGATLLCEAMANIPGNEEFDGRAELTTLAKAYFPKFGYILVHVLLYVTLQAANIAGIIIAAQTMDATLIKLFKWTGALQFYPHFDFVAVTSFPLASNSPFAPGTGVVTLGFLIVFVLTIPLGYVNLDDNIIVQIITCVIMLTLMVEWIIQFIIQGLDFSLVPMFGPDQSQVVGVIVFNFAFVVSIPSWVNEKKKGVRINVSVWYANLLSTFLFLAVGWLGGMVSSFKYSNNIDLLSAFANYELIGPLRYITLASVYLFPIIVLLPGIPVNSIIVRYNLLKSGLMKRRLANFLAVLVPWLVALPFVNGPFLSFINYVSLFVNGLINFIIPYWLYLLSYRLLARMPGTLDENIRRFKAMPMWPERRTRKLARFFIFFAVILTIGGIITGFL